MISEEDLHYLAALIDGEGCIRVWRDHQNTPRARVVVGMRDPEAVTWAFEKFGGSLNRDKHGTHRWACTGYQAVLVLEVVLPYLKLNRRKKAAKRAIKMNADKTLR